MKALPEADEKPAIAALSREAIDQLESQAGGRVGLLTTLSAHPGLTKADREALDLIADPRFDGRKLSTICGKAGISLGRLLQLYKDASIMRGQVQAIQAIAQRAAPVATTILDYAFRQKVVCDICQGLGTIVRSALPGDEKPPEPKECPACEGVGTMLIEPTTRDRQLAAEVVGLVKGGGGVEVNVSAHASAGALALTATDDEFFTKLQAATDQALYGDARTARRRSTEVVDGEITHDRRDDEGRDARDASDDDASPSLGDA